VNAKLKKKPRGNTPSSNTPLKPGVGNNLKRKSMTGSPQKKNGGSLPALTITRLYSPSKLRGRETRSSSHQAPWKV
jgi:hypothetical protein